jgi:cation:H+ antiporter
MTWILFALTAGLIVAAGARLARYGDALGRITGLGGSWVGTILLAATTSLPELVTGFSATVTGAHPEIAVGDVLGSCMFNLLILSIMDAVQPFRLSARAHQGHTLTIGLGAMLIGVVGFGLLAGTRFPALAHVGLPSLVLIGGYLAAVRMLTTTDVVPQPAEAPAAHAPDLPLRQVIRRYTSAAVFVVAGALALPTLAARLAEEAGVTEALVGSVLVALTTSLPEIVVSLAAVRMGAVELAIGNVLGSNVFNLFILGMDDVLYRPGPLLVIVSPVHQISVLAVLLMYAIFLVGVTQHVATKRFRIGWDSAALAVVFAIAVWLTARP